MTKKWMDVKGEIEWRYVVQRMPLEEVRNQMLEDHGFAASIRAYKTKFKEWGWKTYSKECPQDPRYAKKLIFRSRRCRQAVSSICLQVELKNLKETIEGQTILAVQERKELGALQHALNDQTFDSTTAEKLNQSIGRLAKIEETLQELKKCAEGVEGIEARRNTPSGFAACWEKDPMILEDALGRLLLIPLDIVLSWEIFEEHLGSFFQVCPGTKKVQKREYAIEDGFTRVAFSRSQAWSVFSTPGRKVEMSMIFKDKNKSSVVCPKCNTISDEEKGRMIECKNFACKMLFRTEEEEDQPAQQTRSRFPESSGQRRFSIPLRLTNNAEEEEDDEDTPGMFTRVIIKVAKLSQPIQGTPTSTSDLSQGADILWDMFSSELDMTFQSAENCDPFQPFASAGHSTSFDFDDFICNWGEETPSTVCPPTDHPKHPWDPPFLLMGKESTSFEMAPAPQNLLEAGDGAAASRPPHDMLNSPIDWDEMPDFGTEPARAAPPTSNSQVFSGNITQPRDSLQVLKGKVIFGRNFYSFNQAETPEWKRVTGARTRCKACDPIVPHFKNKRWVFYPSNSDVRIVVSCSWSSCERLRPKVKDGEFGLDRACKDLQEKAKCSETGAVP